MSVHQPAASARARLSASPRAAGSVYSAPQPMKSQQVAGNRIWSPMTQCSVTVRGSSRGSRRAAGWAASASAGRRANPRSAVRPGQRPTVSDRACLGNVLGLTCPSPNPVHAAQHGNRKSPGSGGPPDMSGRGARAYLVCKNAQWALCVTPPVSREPTAGQLDYRKSFACHSQQNPTTAFSMARR